MEVNTEEEKHILYLLKNENLSYFKLRTFNKQENKLLLHLAMLNNKLQLVKYLVSKGESIVVNKELLQLFMSKSKYVRL